MNFDGSEFELVSTFVPLAGDAPAHWGANGRERFRRNGAVIRFVILNACDQS